MKSLIYLEPKTGHCLLETFASLHRAHVVAAVRVGKGERPAVVHYPSLSLTYTVGRELTAGKGSGKGRILGLSEIPKARARF